MEEQTKDKLFKISLIVIGLLIAIGLFLNAYLLWKKEKPLKTTEIPTPIPTQAISTPTLTPDATANWKTYTFQPIKLSLKVPPELVVHTEEPNPGAFTAYIQNYPFNAPPPQKNAYQLYIIWQKTPSVTQIEFQQLKDDLNIDSIEDTIIAGYPAIKGQVKGERNRFVAYIIKDNTKISIFTAEPTETNRELTDQILSTFKFIP